MTRMTRIHPAVRAGRWIVAAALAVGMPVHGQDRALPDSMRISASKAIRSRLGGVFVVKIQDTYQHRRSRVFGHAFTVEEVLKPYRNDAGIYWIPLEVNELTSDGKPALEIGKRYLIVTSLKFFAYGWLYVDDKIELGAGDDELMQSMRIMVARDAAYGSTPYLDNSMAGSFDARGLRSPHPDGRLDPVAFGLTRDMARGAKSKGMDLIVARVLDARTTKEGGGDLNVSVIEDLLGKGVEKGQELWLHDPETNEHWHDRSKTMAEPYKLSRFGRGYVGVFLIERRRDGLPVLKVQVPEIHENGPTVRTIRGWVEDKENGRESREAGS